MSTPYEIKRAIQTMDAWLGLPERTYKPTVHLFGRKLPAEQVLAATEIAQRKFPEGGEGAFRYFCGICHKMIMEQRIWEELQAGIVANKPRSALGSLAESAGIMPKQDAG